MFNINKSRYYKKGGRRRKTNFKETKKSKKQRYKNTKGYWEYSWYQKIVKELEEKQIKKLLCPGGGFDPKKIPEYINPILSKEENILQKKMEGKKLNSTERIILSIYKERREKELKKDLTMLREHSKFAKVITKEGRLRKLLIVLQEKISKRDVNMVYYISLKLRENEFSMNDEIKREYRMLVTQMNNIVEKLDTQLLQFTKYHSSMPPLNVRGFRNLDSFQVDVIRNIDARKSTIIKAPTSSGKSVLTGYLYTKEFNKILITVPTDALAWQMAAYITNIIGADIPLVTKTFKTSPNRDKMVTRVLSSKALVGTPESLVNLLVLPELKDIEFDWVVFDEIHMMGKESCSDMELIAKRYSDVPFLALSATIGNVEELSEWFTSLGHEDVQIVECNKRFFNLQRWYFDTDTRNINRIHPLSMISIDSFVSGEVLTKYLSPTPPDIWDLGMKLKSKIDLDKLDPYVYFSHDQHITLDQANEWFSDLIKFMVDISKTEISIVEEILDNYSSISLENHEASLVNLAFTLKEVDKIPAIFFQQNSSACLRMVRQFARDISSLEYDTHPKLRENRLKKTKNAKKVEKKRDKMKIDEMDDRKYMKMMMKGKLDEFEVEEISLKEPHNDFIFNKQQYFNQHMVETWVGKKSKSNPNGLGLCSFFPNTGDDYHYIIDLLWRGVGVYVNGLPDPYLRLVQKLASKAQLAVVFSDTQLVFGVSMPFRTSVIIRDHIIEDDLNPMMYHQMAGRAGRRGLDKEGNVVFVGFSWDRIKELSVSSIPEVKGADTMVFSVKSAEILGGSKWSRLRTNFLHDDIMNDDAIDFYESLDENLSDDGGWHFASSTDINFQHMIWKLRKTEDCFRTALLIPYIIKIYNAANPVIEINQISIALFLGRFLMTEKAKTDETRLKELDILKQKPYDALVSTLDALELSVPEYVDNRMLKCICENRLINQGTTKKTAEIREKLLEFGEMLMSIQHYFFHSKQISITRLLGKLLTRIWWIYHLSSPVMKKLGSYVEDFVMEDFNIHGVDSDDESDDESDYESSDDETTYRESPANTGAGGD